MQSNGEVISGRGYIYQNNRDETYIEFHIDNHPMFTGLGSVHPFGGNLSVRKLPSELPLIIWGQDKCIFRQFIFRNMTWTGPKGETPLMPKTEGQGIMVSRFVSREFGFGWQLSPKQLSIVNKCRENKNYTDEKAAIAKMVKFPKTV